VNPRELARDGARSTPAVVLRMDATLYARLLRAQEQLAPSMGGSLSLAALCRMLLARGLDDAKLGDPADAAAEPPTAERRRGWPSSGRHG